MTRRQRKRVIWSSLTEGLVSRHLVPAQASNQKLIKATLLAYPVVVTIRCGICGLVHGRVRRVQPGKPLVLVWLADHNAQFWMPTAAERDTRFSEVYAEQIRRQRRSAATAAGGIHAIGH